MIKNFQFSIFNFQKTKQRGFSLIEIVIAMAIGAVLVAAIVVSFSSFRNSKTVDISADQILALINEARVKSVSSEDYSRFGVRFEASRAVFFKGDIFTEPNPANIETILSPLVEISNISLSGGGADIVFQKLTGKTGNNGSLRVRLKSDNNKYKTISVKSAGIADIQ